MTTSPLRLAPEHLVFLDNNVVTAYARRRWQSEADPSLLLTSEQYAKVDALLGFVKKGASGNLLASGLLKLESLPALVRALHEGEARLETLTQQADRARLERLLQDYRSQIATMEQYFGLTRLVSISHHVIDTAYSGIEQAALGVMDGLHVATLHVAQAQRTSKHRGRRRGPTKGVFVTLETPWTHWKRPRTPSEMKSLTLRGLFATELVETVHLDHLIVPGHAGG